VTAAPSDSPPAIRTYHYRIDFEGRVLHAGTPIDDPLAVRQLLHRVHRDHRGRTYSLCRGEQSFIEADDVLYVVSDFADPATVGDDARLPVTCQGGLERRLELRSLWLHEQRFLYGSVDGGHAARFGRRAWPLFAERHVRHDAAQDTLVVRAGAQVFPIRVLTATV
jgi:hypothetical protein